MRGASHALSVSVCLLTTLLTGTAKADVFQQAELYLSSGQEARQWQLDAALPLTVAATLPVEWPNGCVVVDQSNRPLGDRRLLSFSVRCRADSPVPLIARAPWKLDGAILYRHSAHGTKIEPLTGDGRHLLIPLLGEASTGGEQQGLHTLRGAVAQGIVHIWFGWDHLCFVALLCLLTQGWSLLGLITAFTVGHSISLALAFFNIVSLPIAPVEALIALSIVLLAREALLRIGEDAPAALRRPYLLLSTFGLLHGLGFASALGALGVASDARVVALLGFNIGVEAGQVVIVVLLVALLAGLQRVGWERSLTRALGLGTGSIGVFWVVERTLALG